MSEPMFADRLTELHCADSLTELAAIVQQQTAPLIIVTDPPYGISYQPYVNKGVSHHRPLKGDDNDSLAQWTLNLEQPKVVFGAHVFWHLLPAGGRLWCWDKRTNGNADRMFGHNFELAWGNIPGSKHRMLRVMHGGVVNADGHGIKRIHPTQKPLAVMRAIISDCDASAIIVDPFAGSGSTLVAARQLGRRSIGIEIEHDYCTAIVARLKDVGDV